jgi:hypothetical protein
LKRKIAELAPPKENIHFAFGVIGIKGGLQPCTGYFSKSRLNAPFPTVINGTNPGIDLFFIPKPFGRFE